MEEKSLYKVLFSVSCLGVDTPSHSSLSDRRKGTFTKGRICPALRQIKRGQRTLPACVDSSCLQLKIIRMPHCILWGADYDLHQPHVWLQF